MDRRSFLVTSSAALAGCYVARGSSLVAPAPRRPVPTASQLAWQRDEMAMFIHFGMNTFTDREVGDGTESPALFNPTAFDARQWAATARDADFRAMVLTAKHHDGFCLWPTATTQHSVASSPWRGGQGDVVQEFVDACRGDNLKVGLYLSPWDRNSPLYGDSPRYNDLYAAQLTELLTRYGKIDEVWFDGADGEGPNGKRQVYDWSRVFAIVRQLQPEAVIFSDAGPDIRWCGNERGVAGDPNWSTIKPESVPFPGADGSDVINALQHGHPLGTVWRPAEVDVSIRPGWFYHPAEDGRVRSVDNLLDLYLSSVGRNGKLLLNVPPTPAGLLHENDVKVLKDFTFRQNKRFDTDMANGLQRVWQVTGPRSADVIINLGGPVTPSIVRLGENIERGQTVVRHSLYGLVGTQKRWTLLSHGTTIGYAKMARLFGAPLQEFRVSIEDCLSAPEPITVTLYE